MEGKNYSNLNLKNEKSFFDEVENIFIVFEGLSFSEKIN